MKDYGGAVSRGRFGQKYKRISGGRAAQRDHGMIKENEEGTAVAAVAIVSTRDSAGERASTSPLFRSTPANPSDYTGCISMACTWPEHVRVQSLARMCVRVCVYMCGCIESVYVCVRVGAWERAVHERADITPCGTPFNPVCRNPTGPRDLFFAPAVFARRCARFFVYCRTREEPHVGPIAPSVVPCVTGMHTEVRVASRDSHSTEIATRNNAARPTGLFRLATFDFGARHSLITNAVSYRRRASHEAVRHTRRKYRGNIN